MKRLRKTSKRLLRNLLNEFINVLTVLGPQYDSGKCVAIITFNMMAYRVPYDLFLWSYGSMLHSLGKQAFPSLCT